jgi:phosphate starvation-inducible protein PhoH and related proteins
LFFIKNIQQLEEILILVDKVDPLEFFGINNSNVKIIQAAFPDSRIVARGNELRLFDENIEELRLIESKINTLLDYLEENENLPEEVVTRIISGKEPETKEFNRGDDVILHGSNNQVIRARTPNQYRLLKAVDKNDIIFAIGPAGTGKTYTAVALAVRALKNKEVRRIILTRPAVEAGENLGFLPGDMREKIDPYLRPLYDALDDMLPPDKLKQHLDRRIIEIAPLAFMRGRTLDNAYVILDEAQNCTNLQLKMFLTRMGPSAKFIVNGDLTQIDLPHSEKSGLVHAINILDNVKGIEIIEFTVEDVTRHKLVKKIIQAYAKKPHPAKEKKISDV